jgi:hypothetical protein
MDVRKWRYKDSHQLSGIAKRRVKEKFTMKSFFIADSVRASQIFVSLFRYGRIHLARPGFFQFLVADL